MPKKNTYGVKRRGGRWVAEPYVAGLKKRVYAGTRDTEQEALEAALAKIEELRTLPPHLETVGSFVARWIRDFPRPKPSTNDTYDFAAKRFAGEFGDRKLHEVSVGEAMAYAKKHPYDAAPLRAMYGDARRCDLILPDRNPFSKLGISKGRGRKDIVAITAEELDVLAELAAAAHPGDFGLRFRSMILFAAYTTMRPSEICGLDRADILDEEIVIARQFYKRRIQPPKRGERRLPFIPPQARRALAEMPRLIPAPICPVTGGEIVFPGKSGQRMTQPALSLYWKPVRTAFEASLTPQRRSEFQAKGSLDFYSLRHCGATQMAEKGVEPWVAAEMMGHTDGGKLFEDTYSHPRESVARERLKRAFAENVKPLRAVDDAEAANG